MKRTISYKVKGKTVYKEIPHIPIRYIIAVLISIFEILAILGIVFSLCYKFHWFMIMAGITHFACVITIIASDDNPDYKVPWLLFVLILPIVGFMLYFMFYSRKLDKKFIKKIKDVQRYKHNTDGKEELDRLRSVDPRAGAQAKMLSEIAYTRVFKSGEEKYYFCQRPYP